MSQNWVDIPAVQRLREYLQVPSVHPDVDYDVCVKFLKAQAADMNLPVQVVNVAPGKPVVIITWEGEHPELKSIMLNSHMDVVPVYEDSWAHPPFDAHITEDGWIYARGSQDMKSISLMHLESIRRLKESGVKLKRTVHVTCVPDEEIGSSLGMNKFVETEHFCNLNVGLALDESCPNVNEGFYMVFYGERTTYQVKIICKGTPGHGSMLPSNTAGEKLHYIIDKFMSLRKEEKMKVDNGKWIGEVTTVNLTQIYGGVQENVVPETLSVIFDVRVANDVDIEDFHQQVETWCKEAGEGVTVEMIIRNEYVPASDISEDNALWVAFRDAVNSSGTPVKSLICPGTTDARLVRSKGATALGFSPLLNTPNLLHANDERVHCDEYLRGIKVMETVLQAVANVN